MTSATQKSTSDTPTTKEPAAYRGPDRRENADRRSGEDRRSTSASPAPEILDQRCGEDRRGGERRNPLRDALYRAGNNAWDARAEAAYKLVPLLAVCEFAARAHHSLSTFEFWATHDNALMERLEGLDPEWRTATGDALIPLHIAQCIGMARNMAAKLADELDAMSEQAYGACEGQAKQEGKQ